MKDYLRYSPSQRRGIIFMLSIIACYFTYLFFKTNYYPELGAIEIINNSSTHNEVIKKSKIQIPSLKNPNTWINSDWNLLGFTDKQIKTINNYKFKLGSFKSKKQLFSCYVFNENHKKMLDTIVEFPKLIHDKIILKSFLFVVSEQKPNYELNKFFDTIFYRKKDGKFHYYLESNLKNKKSLKSSNWSSIINLNIVNLDTKTLKRIIAKKNFVKKESYINKNNLKLNINLSDTSQWKQLKGIGSKRARQIVKYRSLLGGFVTAEQIKEVYNINDSLYNSISQYLSIKDSSIKKININSCTIKQLKNHPYVKWNIANSIVSYRDQHGSYKSLNELLKIHIISNELYFKIVSYLTI